MDTLIIRAKGVATGALPKYDSNNIKFVRQGNGSGTIDITYNVATSQTLTISGGVIVTETGDVTELPTTPGVKNLTIRLNSPIAFLNFQKPYTYLFREINIPTQTKHSPRIDYTHRTTGLNSLSGMFQSNPTFNRPITGLTVADSVLGVSAFGLFRGAVLFNQDLSSWDVSKINNMDNMFSGATSFNQDISGWDVSNVTNMNLMLNNALAFNQDISGWDVRNVLTMDGMISGAQLFNQDLSDWDLNINVRMGSLFSNAGLSASNYSKFLGMLADKDWTGRTQAKTFGAQNVKYDSDGATARAALVADGWTILDGGQE